MRLVFDIEANQLEIDDKLVIHCISAYNLDTNDWRFFDPTQIAEGKQYLLAASELIGHNIIGYDLPALSINPGAIKDTFILSQLLFANDRHAHSLESWGTSLGYPKVKHEEWSVFSEEMKNRCITDVKITVELYKKCLERMEGHNWDEAIRIEQEVYRIYTSDGTKWKVDLALLDNMIHSLTITGATLTAELMKIGKTKVIKHEKPVKAFNNNGKKAIRAVNIAGDALGGDFCAITFEPFNPASVAQMISTLLGMGWRPSKVTEKGNPSLREDPLNGLPHNIKQVISDHRDVTHKLGVLKGLKEKADPVTGDIKMFAYTCGTNTGRFRHSVVTNIQSEFKPLFVAKSRYKLIGCDAAALEARVEGSYTTPYDKGEYAKYLLDSDVHTINAELWGVSRTEAKAPFYAMAYGAGAGKLAQMLNISQERAKEIIDMHYETWYGLKTLIQKLEESVERRGFVTVDKKKRKNLDISKNPWIRGVDGRKLYLRGMHKLKNTLIQSTGSICMKQAYILLAKYIKDNNLDARIVMFYHDEFVVEIKNDEAQIKLLQLGIEDAIVKAGEYFKLAIPLKGESKVGNNWGEIK